MSLDHIPENITSEDCAADIMATIPLVMRFIQTEMRGQGSPHHLSVPQFRTLMFLYLNPGSSLSSLADHLGVTRPTASAIAERLVQRGFIDRREDPQERRAVVLTLTEEGRDRLQQMRQITRTKIAGMLVELSDEQLLYIGESLALLNQIFRESGN